MFKLVMAHRRIALLSCLCVAEIFYAGSIASPAFAASVSLCTGACDAFIQHFINPILNLLTISVGVLATISIVVAGIQYAGSANDPAIVTKAKQRIFNTVVGLIAYLFLAALLNYLIPGGFLG